MSMNWPDEKYVKLYVRDSLTWRAWPWQARAVFPSILRKLDGAGLIETGNLEPAVAIAMQIDFPVEVVRPGLDAILASETLRRVSGGLESPAFIAAQEARKTEALKKRDQRERTAAARRAVQVAELRETPVPTPSHDVPSCPALSPSSPAQPVPSPAQPEKIPPPQKPAPDPRHAGVVADFDRAFRALHGKNYPYAKRDFTRIKALLARGTPEELLAAWQKALHHQGFPTIATIEDFEKHLPRFIGTGPPNVVDLRKPVPPTTFTESKTLENF